MNVHERLRGRREATKVETAWGNVVWTVNVRGHREVQVTGPGRQGEQGGMASMW